MGIYTKKGDTIRGDKIISEARKISSASTINKTNRHKAQRIILKDNAKCVIQKELHFIKKE